MDIKLDEDKINVLVELVRLTLKGGGVVVTGGVGRRVVMAVIGGLRVLDQEPGALDGLVTARTNGGRTCDVDHGPCACGAWHKPTDSEVVANPLERGERVRRTYDGHVYWGSVGRRLANMEVPHHMVDWDTRQPDCNETNSWYSETSIRGMREDARVHAAEDSRPQTPRIITASDVVRIRKTLDWHETNDHLICDVARELGVRVVGAGKDKSIDTEVLDPTLPSRGGSL